ncbi:MAG: hypothetical protein HKN32_00870, partial [Flavobacteriales bacterium]|nr:hypothetical protein [Flavobacteriales bacterium]
MLLFSGVGLAQCEVDAGPDQTICSGESIQIGGTPTVISGNNPTLAWDNGAGTGDNPTVSPISTTTYEVTLTAEGGCTDTDEVEVTVLPAPSADFTFGPDNECAGTVVNFVNESTGCTGCTYEWDFDNPASGGSNTSSTADPTHTFV